MYITAGHKGQPEMVASLGRKGRRRKLRGKPGRGTLEGEEPPVLDMLQRSGEVVIQMVLNVQHVTIKALITETITPGCLIYTDAYNIYDSLPAWSYQHKSVNHAAGEYARDEDGDGFHEVHVNILEGFWSLLRSWLRPHRGISIVVLGYFVPFAMFDLQCLLEYTR